MSTATAVDHFADAIRGALAIRLLGGELVGPDGLLLGPQSASGPWISTEYPAPFPGRPAATQTPGRTAQPVNPTHHPRTSHSATSTTLALSGRGSR